MEQNSAQSLVDQSSSSIESSDRGTPVPVLRVADTERLAFLHFFGSRCPQTLKQPGARIKDDRGVLIRPLNRTGFAIVGADIAHSFAIQIFGRSGYQGLHSARASKRCRSDRPGDSGSPGDQTIQRLDGALLVDVETAALSGGLKYRPTSRTRTGCKNNAMQEGTAVASNPFRF